LRRIIVLIGDFNLPEVDWEMGETTRRSRDLVEALDDQLLVQMVDFLTHIKGNVLDLVLTNIPERITEINDNGRLGSGDHTMLMVSVQVGRVQQPAKKVKNWRKADWDKMREDMRGVDWKRELHGLTVDCMWTVLERKVEATVKKNVPLRMEAAGVGPAG
jgi:hypothetical protein